MAYRSNTPVRIAAKCTNEPACRIDDNGQPTFRMLYPAQQYAFQTLSGSRTGQLCRPQNWPSHRSRVICSQRGIFSCKLATPINQHNIVCTYKLYLQLHCYALVMYNSTDKGTASGCKKHASYSATPIFAVQLALPHDACTHHTAI